ncbi:MAG TPA: anti-sigma factor [Terriglobales bacterium]|nr:anti-sigma factor [Terriglobales bacterium]
MESEREVAGLWCSQVLAYLSEFHDNELSPGTVMQIEEHLAGCDWCERFGTQFSAMIGELVRQLAIPEALSEQTIARLHERLRDI